MDGNVPENGKEKSGAVSHDLLPNRRKKELNAMKAPYSVKRITFNPSEANPGERLEVRVPKLNKNEVLVPGSLALRFDIDLSCGHANNHLVQNVSCALVSQQVVKFGGTTLDNIVHFDVYKIFTDLFLPEETRGNMVAEGIQSKKLSQIRSGAGDKPTTGVDAENKLEKVYGKKYRINLDHQIMTDHGVFYPQALYTDLVFELVLVPADQVVLGPDKTKLKYKLTSLEPYTAEARDSEKYGFPDLEKVHVTINGSPNMVYKNGIESKDAWRQASRFFMKQKHKPQNMTLQKYYAEDKFGLLIDLRSMASQEMHGSGTRLVNSTDGVQLEIKRATGKGPFNCHIFVISDAQFNIQNRQLSSVQY